MGDDDERARVGLHEPLESCEAVEVEIVRRLVEEQDIETREQNRRQREPCRLSTRERLHDAAHVDREIEVGKRRRGPRLEIRAAEREKSRQCAVVVVGRTGIIGKPTRGRAERRLGGAHTCPASEIVPQRLVIETLGLLLEIPGCEPRRDPGDRARVGRDLTRDQPQKRRLANAVRAYDAESASITDRERDPVEHRVGALQERDLNELNVHVNGPPCERKRCRRRGHNPKDGCVRSVRHRTRRSASRRYQSEWAA